MSETPSCSGTEIAVLGGGCFWCVEAVFKDLRGVVSVLPGYAGGHVDHPTYQQVCNKDTGHIEVARIEFDPAELSYADLLRVFFATHDPTTPGRQGNDVGPQYESAIFWQNDKQRQEAQAVIGEIDSAQIYDAPIVTKLLAPATFWPAEDYHRDYFALHPEQGYCQFVIAPKVSKFRKQFQSRLKS
ncbi:peptide-methionine (S)-S-oxide reductase MsrA [Bordetella avium]|uniref:Peptide methionine sulfoxide reductase MsrA n=1 Tax=Bordetella avium (strain 197N) TaxID=360910 RepID=Q2KVC4_BORA1|nr:peptide-methionine (S)-S-oxide reductase MsrA [Bordetella avium]AZY50255.1 peptide-methionine (S)-S-oxide reductase [Bordetella avium]AZY53649.1 peptide-methionine (S)-S-oxide reductase [Bordetella avium]RIQ15577.1 peptide-methionine (S)-S-oxide reductase [Bordetella avium]RIQ19619.1 peptide-methionine (S)-S-oxide reductase [Bordetella avium]RIQ34198.1 peptide-methionine (S)-S-oxide reductase [Bordetella avium]